MSAVALATSIRNACVAAGWTDLETCAWQGFVKPGVDVAEGATITLDGLTYKFKAVIDNAQPRQILRSIGNNGMDMLTNLKHAIEDDGVGKGTLYSTATTVHPTVGKCVVYQWNYGAILVWALTPGQPGNLIPYSFSWSGMSTLQGGTHGYLSGAGYRLVSTPTQDGHQVALEVAALDYLTDTEMVFHFGDPTTARDGNRTSVYCLAWSQYDGGAGSSLMPCTGGRTYRIIAHRHGMWIAIPGSHGPRTNACVSTLAVPDRMRPKVLADAVGGDGELVTCTVAAHGMGAGGGVGSVYIYGSKGLSIDGMWPVTIVDENKFVLDNSTAVLPGSYEAGSAVCANTALAQIARALVGYRASSGEYMAGSTWYPGIRRDFPYENGKHPLIEVVNAHENNARGTSTLRWQIEVPTSGGLHWAGNNYWLTPAAVKWSRDPDVGPLVAVGWLYGAALLHSTLPLDSEGIDIHGQKWITWAPDPAVVGGRGYSLILAIPPGFN